MYKKCHLHSELQAFNKSNMSTSFNLEVSPCLLQEAEKGTAETEAKILAGGGVSYVLQSAVHKHAQHPGAVEAGDQTRTSTHKCKLLILTVPPSVVPRHEFPHHNISAL